MVHLLTSPNLPYESRPKMAVERTELAKSTPASKKAGASKIPAGAKVPDDHRSAKEEVNGVEDTVVEWNGVEYTVKAEDMDDAELMEYFTDENFIGALRILVGADGWAKYKANERDERGRVSASGASEFLGHVLSEVKAKNS